MTKNICNICLEDTKTLYGTPCRHSFCKECISVWLLQNNSCPSCRQTLYNIQDKQDKQDNDDDYNVSYCTKKISHHEYLTIKSLYREDFYDMCDDLLEDIEDIEEDIEDIEYCFEKNTYTIHDIIENKLFNLHIKLIYYKDDHDFEFYFTIIYIFKPYYPKIKCNFINNRGILLNKNFFRININGKTM